MIRLGPVPIVVPVPPQFADMETHIANMARFDLELNDFRNYLLVLRLYVYYTLSIIKSFSS